MQVSQIPVKIPTPFASSAGSNYVRTVPVPSQIGINNGAASFTDGFPPLCFTQEASGGYPPDGRDMNYMFGIITQWLRWSQAGGTQPYDATFSTGIGGYPNGAIVASADHTGLWRSTADNNTGNPDTGATNWLPVTFYGLISIALSNSNVTLSITQAVKPIIIFTGTITANITVTLPPYVGQWVFINNTTGSFTITVTMGGAGVNLGSGGNPLVSDGTNMYSEASGYLTTTQAAITYAPMASGTLVSFQQASAPTGWTLQTTYNDALLRIVSGSPGSGGSQAFSAWNALTATGGHAIAIGEMPAHNHGITDPGHTHTVSDPGHHHTYNAAVDGSAGSGGAGVPTYVSGNTGTSATGISNVPNTTGISTQNNGSNTAHTHPLTNGVNYVDFIIARKN